MYEQCIKSTIAGASVMLVGDSPSAKDVKAGRCFSGEGAVALAKTLAAFGHTFDTFHKATVLDYYPPSGDATNIFMTTKATRERPGIVCYHNAFVPQKAMDSVQKLWAFIDEVKPKRILGVGAMALWALYDFGSISAWRGSQLIINRPWGDIEFLPTFHPSALMKKPEWRIPFNRDLHRFFEEAGNFDMPQFNILIEGTFQQYVDALEDLLQRLNESPDPVHVSVDLETRSRYITVCGLATSPRDAIVIPFTSVDAPNYFDCTEELIIAKLLKHVLEHPNIRISGQNFQYDIQYFASVYAIYPKIWRDTMVEAHAMWTKSLELKLGFLSSLMCKWYRYWKDDGKSLHTMIKLKTDQIKYWLYNGYDCCNTFEVAEAMNESWELKPNKQIVEFQRKMQNIVVKPSLRGFRLNTEVLEQYVNEIGPMISQYEQWFDYMIPDELTLKGGMAWYRSPTKLSYFLYTVLGIEPVLDKKTKRPTAGDDALKIIAKREPILQRVMNRLQEYRSLTQFYNLYLKVAISPDGRVRTQYILPGTDTFRLASKKDGFDDGLNLQNLSKGG